jgi:4-amino-4-deoxy-L-arabinose transferase-like glycosyltransferase
VTSRSPWRDPSSRQIAVVLAIALALGNGIWLLLDHSVASWDESHYLLTTLNYQRSLEAGGPIEFLHAVKGTDPSHGPLFTIGLLPFLLIFGASNSSGLLLNLCAAPFLYFCVGEIAWEMFKKWQAKVLAMVIAAGTPIVVGLSHFVLQDFLLVTFATASVLLLWKSEGFQRRGMVIGMAVTMALGTLTKVTFPLFMIGPLAVVSVQVALGLFSERAEISGLRIDGRKLAWNLGIAALVFLVLAFAWYGPNFSATLDYVRSTTGGPLAEGAGPKHPFTFNAITMFTLGVINYNLSWVVLLAGAIAVMLCWTRLRDLFRGPVRTGPLWKLSFLLAWAVVPYLSVALAHNQDVRLMAPAFPAVAILTAGAITSVSRSRARWALAGATVLCLTYLTVNHVVDVTPGFFPEQAKVSIDEYVAAQQLDTQTMGYEQFPGDDFSTPIVAYLEELAARQPGGLSVLHTVCDLQSEATTNPSSMNFLAAARGAPLNFVQVERPPGPGGQQALQEYIAAECPLALYVKQPKVPVLGAESRLALVNEPMAASHMTPEIFGLFDGPRRTFPLVSPSGGDERPNYLSSAGAAATVLSQKAG